MHKTEIGEQTRNSTARAITRRSFFKRGVAAGLGIAAFSGPHISRSASASELSFWALGYTSDPRNPTGKWPIRPYTRRSTSTMSLGLPELEPP
jgi:hypothetical protein